MIGKNISRMENVIDAINAIMRAVLLLIEHSGIYWVTTNKTKNIMIYLKNFLVLFLDTNLSLIIISYHKKIETKTL